MMCSRALKSLPLTSFVRAKCRPMRSDCAVIARMSADNRFSSSVRLGDGSCARRLVPSPHPSSDTPAYARPDPRPTTVGRASRGDPTGAVRYSPLRPRIVAPVHQRIPPCGLADIAARPLREVSLGLTDHLVHVRVVVVELGSEMNPKAALA